jgi:hypothetical protein
MTASPTSDFIWNRAAMEGGGPHPEEGDAALASLLRFHSLAMSGGVLDAIERLSVDQLRQAAEGFRWFGLGDAASFVESASQRWQASGRSVDAAEELESQFDVDYAGVVPNDETLLAAFEERHSIEPTAFAAPA